jgi:transcription termination/antitermination protein NusA
MDVDDVIAHLLVAEGFAKVEEIVETPIEELNAIEGFEEEISTELQNRARNFLEQKRKELEAKQKELGMEKALVELDGLTPSQFIKLGEAGIKTRDDLADLSGSELIELLGPGELKASEADNVIMNARAHWFENENENQAQEQTA